jgi:hypothetical protein
MALKECGKYRYGESQADIRAEVLRYGKKNAYPAHPFADCLCACGGKRLRLLLDDAEGAAVRTFVGCDCVHPRGDSDEYLEEADLEGCACPCGGEEFQITADVSLYEGSEDAR